MKTLHSDILLAIVHRGGHSGLTAPDMLVHVSATRGDIVDALNEMKTLGLVTTVPGTGFLRAWIPTREGRDKALAGVRK